MSNENRDEEATRLEDLQQPRQLRRIDRFIADYREHYKTVLGRIIHALAAPAIAWAVLALLWSLPFPSVAEIFPGFNWASIVAGLAILYYLSLSIPLALGMIGVALLSFFLIGAYENWGDLPLWQVGIVVLLPAWLLQIIAQKIEGRQTGLPEDLHDLLIAPLSLLGLLYRLIGFRY